MFVKGVQCYELFGGIALKNHTFSFFHFHCEYYLASNNLYRYNYVMLDGFSTNSKRDHPLIVNDSLHEYKRSYLKTVSNVYPF